ncbi:glutamate receptor-like [Penaeus japonicus]|nr:glutamate receptor-like [Penaeus japonicus]
MVLLGILFWAVALWYRRQEERSKSPSNRLQRFKDWQSDASMVMWAALTQQGWTITPEVSILRAVFWIAYMVGVVVVAAYSATLVSFLTVQADDLPFDSLADIQRIGKHRLGILKGSVLEEFFKNQNFKQYLNSLILPYPDTLAKSYKELRAQALKDSDFAYVGTYEIQRLDSVGACTFRSARQHLLFNDGSLGWPKGSQYIQIFDHFISRLRESGLLQKLLLDWFPDSYYSCPDQPVVALGLKQVFTAFVMLGCGILASVIFLCCERSVFQFHYYPRTIYRNA